jgi:hypothetical protein
MSAGEDARSSQQLVACGGIRQKKRQSLEMSKKKRAAHSRDSGSQSKAKGSLSRFERKPWGEANGSGGIV